LRGTYTLVIHKMHIISATAFLLRKSVGTHLPPIKLGLTIITKLFAPIVYPYEERLCGSINIRYVTAEDSCCGTDTVALQHYILETSSYVVRQV